MSIEAARRAAQQLETMRLHGIACGLTADEVKEVSDAWTQWYRKLPIPIDYRFVMSRVTDRAMGEPWMPPSDDVTELACRLAAQSGMTILDAVRILQALIRPTN